MTNEEQRRIGHHLHQRWISMWNGDLRMAQEIIADRFKAHLSAEAVVPPVEARDPASVAAWVTHVRSRSQRLTYHVVLGPMVDSDKVISYWQAVGHARPLGSDAVQPFTRVGVDILRFNGGRVEECWTLANHAQVPARLRF